VWRNQQENLADNFTNIFNLHGFEWKEEERPLLLEIEQPWV
jgi:hypothetical protein